MLKLTDHHQTQAPPASYLKQISGKSRTYGAHPPILIHNEKIMQYFALNT
jgi:hypothetical protein